MAKALKVVQSPQERLKELVSSYEQLKTITSENDAEKKELAAQIEKVLTENRTAILGDQLTVREGALRIGYSNDSKLVKATEFDITTLQLAYPALVKVEPSVSNVKKLIEVDPGAEERLRQMGLTLTSEEKFTITMV